ncbi:MAG: NUDIX hydrolase [Bacteroidia bacterium]|nr:NUDIX hydrolase [Bacteroidia bacterium]
MKNPWKTLSSKIIYDNPWIKVQEDQVLNPSGKPGIYGTIHFKNQAVGVVPYEDGYIWMVGQYRYPLDIYSWEIPEGGGLWDENPLDTAKRELQEETGLRADRYEKLLEMHISNSVTDEWGIVYLAQGLKEGEANPEEDEDIRVEKMSLDYVYGEVEAGKITDSLTVAAIYKLMLLKAQGKLK